MPDSAIFFFQETAALAEATASILGLQATPIQQHRFPDGESLVRAECGEVDRALLFCSLDQPNAKLIELLLAADAIRRQGVRQLTLVAPYLAYMRQDRVFHPGEPLSQRVIAGLLDSAFDDLLTVEAHLHRIQSLSEVFACRAQSLSAARPIASWLRRQVGCDLLVGPDSESEPWIRSIAEQIGTRWVVGQKVRSADSQVAIKLSEIPSDVRTAWIVDDIASSGATLETIAGVLKNRGVLNVGAVIVHALFSDETLARLGRAGVDPIVSTDSIPHASNVISLAPLLAEQIAREPRLLEESSCSA